MFQKEKRFFALCAVIFAVLSTGGCGGSVSDTSSFAGGNGTAESPWQIATVKQLDAVRNDLNAHYILTADIDLGGTENWESIGSCHFDEDESIDFSYAFNGTFDGNGHVISNVTSRASAETVGVGLIGITSSTAIVKNLIVRNVISEGGMAVGGIVGYNCGTVENLSLDGENSISGYNCIGGILGGNDGGTISNCTGIATVYVLGDNDFSDGRYILPDNNECGGIIVGGSFGGTIANCSAKGKIISEGHDAMGLGGVGGCLEFMESITNCAANVVIEAGKDAHGIGGLCGFAGMFDAATPARISGCSVIVTINNTEGGATHVGGLVGTGLFMNMFGMESVFEISDCEVSADINGAQSPGSVAGRAVGSIIKSCAVNVRINGSSESIPEIGTTDKRFESAE